MPIAVKPESNDERSFDLDHELCLCAPRGQTICELLQRSIDFSYIHTTWLEQKFAYANSVFEGMKPEDIPSLPDPTMYFQDYTIKDHIHSTTAFRIAEDRAIFYNALGQRILQDGSFELPENQTSGKEVVLLHHADRLADRAFQNIVSVGVLPNVDSVLTYYGASTNTRLVPYADVPLIRIPTHARRNSVEFWAIPHEIAHYLFWRGHFTDEFQNQENFEAALRLAVNVAIDCLIGDLDDSALEFPAKKLEMQRVKGWLEEIFADVVSCYIGGPLVALSMQLLMLEFIGDNFANHEDDQAHPTPYLRPYIYTYTLNKLGMSDASNRLKSLWDQIVQDRKDAQSFSTIQDTDTTWAAIQKVIDSIIEVFPSETLEVAWSNSNDIVQALAIDSILNNQEQNDISSRRDLIRVILMDKMDDIIDSLPITQDTIIRELKPFDDKAGDIWRYAVKNRLGIDLDQLTASGTGLTDDNKFAIYAFKGWGTVGPTGANPH